MFPHVKRACQGVIFHSLEIAQQFIARTKTNTHLTVTVGVLDKVYAISRKCAAAACLVGAAGRSLQATNCFQAASWPSCVKACISSHPASYD